MKRILVPTDFSECADNAFNFAVEAAIVARSELHLVHLMDVPVDWLKLVDKDQKQLYPDITKKVNQANNSLNRMMAQAEKSGLKVRKFIAYNLGYTYLKDHISKNSCDMVIMGSNGASGFTEWLIGSNTQKVVRLSAVPVFVIKRKALLSKMDHIVFASDFHKDMRKGFFKLLDIIKVLKLKLHLLYINTPVTFTETDEIDKKMNWFIKTADGLLQGSYVYNCYEFEEGIKSFLGNHSDIIAMISHGYKGGLTESIINHINAPVLSIKANGSTT